MALHDIRTSNSNHAFARGTDAEKLYIWEKRVVLLICILNHTPIHIASLELVVKASCDEKCDDIYPITETDMHIKHIDARGRES